MDRIASVEFIHNRNRDGITDRYDGILGDYFDIFLTLKPGAFDRQGYKTLNLGIEGYHEARTCYTPKYNTPTNKPDLRTTIHWEPSITTNTNGEVTVSYYNADPKTKVRIVAEGITDKGVPVVGTTTYEVR